MRASEILWWGLGHEPGQDQTSRINILGESDIVHSTVTIYTFVSLSPHIDSNLWAKCYYFTLPMGQLQPTNS